MTLPTWDLATSPHTHATDSVVVTKKKPITCRRWKTSITKKTKKPGAYAEKQSIQAFRLPRRCFSLETHERGVSRKNTLKMPLPLQIPLQMSLEACSFNATGARCGNMEGALVSWTRRPALTSISARSVERICTRLLHIRMGKFQFLSTIDLFTLIHGKYRLPSTVLCEALCYQFLDNVP